MSANLKLALSELKEALLQLQPTGDKGFEGLLAHILSHITKQDFRLASSGLQLGIDGETLAGLNHISFEGKLYNGTLNKDQILSKITSIIASSSPPDIWILGATIGVNTQLLDQAGKAAEKNGIELLVFDWPNSSAIPPLAAACTMAADKAKTFFDEQIADKVLVAKANKALKIIANDSAFVAVASQITAQLAPGSLGVPIALKRNAAWLNTIFKDSNKARMDLGQRLAPFAEWPLKTQSRDAIVSSIQDALISSDHRKIIAILGMEGVGKSWLLAQSWKATTEPPITLIVPAADIDQASFTDFDSFLIANLIKQTQDRNTEFTRIRWSKRFERWRSIAPTDRPRIVLFIDGLNQHSKFDWPRWLDGAASKLADLGGKLAITDRIAHFNSGLSSAVATAVQIIEVTEWSSLELAKILADKNVNADQLSQGVKQILCNPRVLGIAFELIKLGSIKSFKELSIGRLMFEHIRTSELHGNAIASPAQFSKRLSKHANEIIQRVQLRGANDQLVFEIDGEQNFELESGLLDVVSERYFSILEGDETLYQITNEGLSYALGLSIIASLREAKRAGKDLANTLDCLLEPIEALDKTAEAVFNASLIANVDSRCATDISATLQATYIQLQNVSDETFEMYCASQRLRPEASMLAIEMTVAAQKNVSRDYWLTYAVRESRSNTSAWKEISTHLKIWISKYSLDPDLSIRVNKSNDSQKYHEELTAIRERISIKIASLSDEERRFMQVHMKKQDSSDPALLWCKAFEILAGMPLLEFAQSFVAWAIGTSLNSNMNLSIDSYIALIRFNTNDWHETREAILVQTAFLQQNETSETGKWALVYLLRGTATVEDSLSAKKLVDVLTADRKKYKNWRLVENYCATDPCDPNSEEPKNIGKTAQDITKLNISALSAHESVTSDDHLLHMVLPSLARFRPQTALSIIQSLANSVAQRSGRSLFLCLVELESHSAALSRQNVEILLKAAQTPIGNDKEGKYAWLSSQYSLILSFPHITGNEQLEALENLQPENAPLIKLLDTIKQVSSASVEDALENVLNLQKNQKVTIISFASLQKESLTCKAQNIIMQFIDDPDSAVRAESFALMVKLDDKILLQKFINSPWPEVIFNTQQKSYEQWHGSVAIIRAAKHSFISIEEAMKRIDTSALHRAALELGSSVGSAIATRLSAALTRSLEANIVTNTPQAERRILLRPSVYPTAISLSNELKSEDESFSSQFRRLKESPEDFDLRQQQAWKSFEQFEAELTAQQARMIIQDIGKHAISCAISSSPTWAIDTANTLLAASEEKLCRVNNFSLRLACEMSTSEPTLAMNLFKRTSTLNGIVNLVYGPAKIPLASYCIWGGADNETWNILRAERLNSAGTDHELSVEVLAALLNGNSSFLYRYVTTNLSRPEPVAIARALLVLGYGEPSDFAARTIANYEKFEGFIGNAAKKARYAYEREVWSRHWYKLMSNTNSAQEFWRWSILLLKIVDGRFAIWYSAEKSLSKSAELFVRSIETSIEKRVERWKKDREKSLLGEKVPARIFIDKY